MNDIAKLSDYPLVELWKGLQVRQYVEFHFEKLDFNHLKHLGEDQEDVVDQESSLQFVRSLELSDDKFAVHVSLADYATFWRLRPGSSDSNMCPGKTLITRNGKIRQFQPVLFRRGSARFHSKSFDGLIFELDKEFVTAWDGTQLGMATSRFIGQSRFD